MAVEHCLTASHGCSPGSALVFRHQEQNRLIKDCQPYFPGQVAKHEVSRHNSLNFRLHQHEVPWKSANGFSDSNHLAMIGSSDERPVLIDVQGTNLDSTLFSYGIAAKCAEHEKIQQFLMSGPSELERDGLDLSFLSDLMGIQALTCNAHQQSFAPLFYPGCDFDAPKPLVDFMEDMARSSKITVLPDGRIIVTDSGAEMKDILSIVSEFYLSKNSTKSRKNSMLVPQFSRFETIEAPADVLASSLKVKGLAVAPLKSTEKVKLKPSTKKRHSKKGVKVRDLYKRNYFHACESLLSLMMDKKQHGKAAILSLKKSGPELPKLLNHFSAGIAGTGLAVLFSVVCKVACGRVPFCSSKLFSTGFGFGLVWLSWAVNKLRDTIVHVSKNAGKLALKDEEMMASVDRNLKEIYFRAATVMAVAVLRLA